MSRGRQAPNTTRGAVKNGKATTRSQPSLTSEQRAEIIIAAVGGQVLEQCRRIRRGEEVIVDRESG